MLFIRQKWCIVLILVLSSILTACSEDPAPSIQMTASPAATTSPLPSPTLSVTSTPLPSPSPSQGHNTSMSWQISFVMSGGFAGVIRSVELSDDGLLRATDERTGRRSEVQISAADLAAISAWVAQVQPMPSLPRFSDCRDCLHYDITIRRGSETLTAELTDLNLDQSALSLLINKLAALQETALSMGQ